MFKPQEAAATKMVGVVIAVFLSCYLLTAFNNVFHLAGFYTGSEMAAMAVEMALILLRLLNSAINPVAYALFKREIRKEVKRLFCCGRQH